MHTGDIRIGSGREMGSNAESKRHGVNALVPATLTSISAGAKGQAVGVESGDIPYRTNRICSELSFLCRASIYNPFDK